jgi:hypothetical protein
LHQCYCFSLALPFLLSLHSPSLRPILPLPSIIHCPHSPCLQVSCPSVSTFPPSFQLFRTNWDTKGRPDSYLYSRFFDKYWVLSKCRARLFQLFSILHCPHSRCLQVSSPSVSTFPPSFQLFRTNWDTKGRPDSYLYS